MFCLKITVLVATNMTADGRTPDHKSQKFGNKHVMLHVLTVGFTASDDVMCWSGLILCMCNSSTCGWSRRKEASKISAMNTWAGFTPTLLTCDSAVLYWHTNWNNCQPISSLWCAETYFLNKKRCTVTSVYRTVVLESEIILHSEIEQRTEVSSLLELGAGGLNKCDLIYPQEAFDR